MEALQLLKFSLKQGHPLWTLQQVTSWDDELAEVEIAHNAHEPEDIGFLCHCFEYTDIVEFLYKTFSN